MPLLQDNARRMMDAIHETQVGTVINLCAQKVIPVPDDCPDMTLEENVRRVLSNDKVFAMTPEVIDAWMREYRKYLQGPELDSTSNGS